LFGSLVVFFIKRGREQVGANKSRRRHSGNSKGGEVVDGVSNQKNIVRNMKIAPTENGLKAVFLLDFLLE